MKDGWRLARFDEILTKVDRKFIIDDGQEYKTVGVRWYGNGSFIRDRLLGANISRKQQWTIKAGDVVYNKLFAWKNAFAVADEVVDGCIVSDKFPTYHIKPDLIDPKYLAYYFMTPQVGIQVQNLSKGAAAISKLTLNPPQFWDLTIPLPPLDEQRRIAKHLEFISEKINKSIELREEGSNEIAVLSFRAFDIILESCHYEIKLLETLLSEKLQNGLSLPASGIGDHGVLFAKVGMVNSGSMNPKETKRVDIDLPPNSTFWMQPGDIFISRGNSLELVGRAAVYRGIPENCAFADLLIRIRVDKNLLDPQFLIYYLQSVSARKYIETQASGTSPTMKKVSQPKLEQMPIPVPSLDEQRRIVAYLDSVQARLASLRELQSQTREELGALLPSVLDRAFKGEL